MHTVLTKLVPQFHGEQSSMCLQLCNLGEVFRWNFHGTALSETSSGGGVVLEFSNPVEIPWLFYLYLSICWLVAQGLSTHGLAWWVLCSALSKLPFFILSLFPKHTETDVK